jgi:hypothetical protein
MVLNFAFLNFAYSSAWDVEYWQYFNIENWKSERFRLYTVAEIRANQDISQVYHYKIAEELYYQPLSNLEMGLNYNFIYSKASDSSEFDKIYRLGIEINPIYKFSKDITIKWRNRLEVIKRESTTQTGFIFRHRIQMKYPIKNRGKLVSVNCSDEIFYDCNQCMFTQNRFIPIELTYQLDRQFSISIFAMIRNFSSQGKWQRSAVIGSKLDF